MKWKRILETGGVLLLACTIVVNAYILICGAQGRVVTLGGHCILRVATGSMEPSLQVGDYILVACMEADALTEGDIISFYSDDPAITGKINTHRIMARTEGGFITKGDANPDADDVPAADANIIGRYQGKIRFLRWLHSFRSLKKLVLLAVILLALGIAIYEVVTISRLAVDMEPMPAQTREELLRAAIEEEKQRLREEGFSVEEVMKDESGSHHETEDVHRGDD